MNNFESKQRKAYLIFFSCAVILIIFLIFVCAGGFKNNQLNNSHSNSPSPSATATTFTQDTTLSPSVTVTPSPNIGDHMTATPSDTVTATPSDTATATEFATQTPAVPIYPEQQALLQFAGDVVLHSSVLTNAQPGGYAFDTYFENIKKYLKGDAVFVNLEGVIEGDENYSGYPLFNYPSSIASALKNAGITDVITANDRAFDKLASGLVSTQNSLTDADLSAIGTYTSAEQANTPYIKEVNGIKIGVIAYSDGANNMQQHMPEEYSFAMKMIDWSDLDKTVANITADITAARSAGAELIVLSLHWGTEYTFKQTDEQKALAQRVLESGADIIMGTRPHMVQPITVKNVKINGQEKKVVVMYSLGNFFADQTDLNQDRTQAGAIVNIFISRNTFTNQIEIGEVQYIPTYIYKYTNLHNETSYSILATDEYSKAAELPALFTSKEDWDKCKNAATLIKDVIGNKVTKADLSE